MESSLLLPAFYLPPVSYFHVIQQHEIPICIEKFEHYPKQTYRTRAKIATANGVLDMIVPIEHGRKERVAMKDIRINYEFNWQRLHWLSLQTAYRSSPYFEYYEDDFSVFYEKQFDFLLDFNVEQLKLILKCLKIQRSISYTESYNRVDGQDFRSIIHPKKESLFANPKSYYQVFEEKHGFLPDLSVVDLLFNQGPQSKSFL
ncbi:WbqC family protein [Sphingobacterium wenxiniae]|uniref:WbqC-like protein family protein n=1 Tax=Sphingobacterium wenxiniae TaxID=683125 RepID=A0A1I6P7W7_9SPHI|nr:WbqC family protein [Sphingobacterium wenxiniae]SFS36256.1 WbqC-like protein family protein [Sphingobacterium wenxiniae]